MVGSVERPTVGRYAGIVWENAADFDDSISFVRAFDNPDEAMSELRPRCGRDERWAVVDLNTFGVVATGQGDGHQQLELKSPSYGI